MWNVSTFCRIATLKGHGSEIDLIRFSPNGKTLAFGGVNNRVKMRDLETLKGVKTLSQNYCKLISIQFSANGKIMASEGLDNTIKLWKIVRKKKPNPIGRGNKYSFYNTLPH